MDDRLAFLEKTAGFRRIDLHWCLTLEPPKVKALRAQAAGDMPPTPRGCWPTLKRRQRLLEGHLGSSLGIEDARQERRHSSSSATCSILKSGPLKTDFAAIRRGPADREEPGCMAQRPPHNWQAIRPDVLSEDNAGSIAALPVLGPLDARLRQRAVHDVAAKVHVRRAQRDRRAGEVHLVLQSRRADARDERARYRVARNRRRRAGGEYAGR